ncbi:type VII secretion protein EssB/YukC [Clostridium sp. Marseille-P3244]|uniref:type VII secretion protein EssB/YukC n=1 Tax=Clostridium sp. Marseille-P3244 TaxID=1871020 RepID=UPI000931EF92|nr:type VII secretion protein EssB/YukC [Clostridium sp. Marseille-P3244]
MRKEKNTESNMTAAPAAEETKASVEIRVQKADMAAKTIYDYRRLEQENPLMLPCEIEEEKETLCMKFDTADMMPAEQLKKESRIRKMEVLMQAAELESLYMQFEFSLQPDNLYYDRLGKVKVMKRDIVSAGNDERKQQFLNMYQALIGYIMDGSRPYGDYLSGGAQILKKKDEFVKLMKPETLEEEKKLLVELYETARKKEQDTTMRVDRKTHRALTVYAVISAVALAALAAACVYSFAWYMPRQDKIAAANDAYLQRDYIGVIDSLREFSAEDMDRPQKYILATAYIQGQAVDTFSTADKEAILSKITYQANETVLDYWIHLGRLEVAEAEELAMQMSDDQLLLYAYMQELDQLDKDTSIPGSEKSSREAELKQEIQSIADDLGIVYGEEETAGTDAAAGTGETAGGAAGTDAGAGTSAGQTGESAAGSIGAAEETGTVGAD